MSDKSAIVASIVFPDTFNVSAIAASLTLAKIAQPSAFLGQFRV
jgi:hypothetical protein